MCASRSTSKERTAENEREPTLAHEGEEPVRRRSSPFFRRASVELGRASDGSLPWNREAHIEDTPGAHGAGSLAEPPRASTRSARRRAAAKDCRADAEVSRTARDRHLEVVAHPHRQHRQRAAELIREPIA